ncbi:mannose-1-phosphate guanylyltransferase [Punctularia strigosozonata HHB-11173 SS5]|uniref:mannose-1-phosphate guanylyltransferase n=1 Tax=Punctularia strigosozonata (strain HHB-11173) TaxID=741275 RepID=UPI0004417372|nr:mannose-1-phosphate guanylyltransferase [Punctularia strigosozonata HHB-11173 SS5]EIN12073.1 mannose-1-phosphate guanylyltransferase [Punctularia strigosozonata HHB-11173 SS5]
MSGLGFTPAPQPAPNALGVEGMFAQIMAAVQKSSAEIAELRQECADLRIQNASLERQVREGLQNRGTHTGYNTGLNTPVPGSPQLRAKSPFLSPSSIPALAAPASIQIPTPSPLGDNQLTYYPFNGRSIPGFFVVIPAGGAGTRLWPLSREGHPKFLLDLTLKGRSLIQATWDRLIPLSSPARTTIVAGPAHTKSIREQLPDLLEQNLFTEPGAKDSMAAIGLAAAVLARRDPDAVIGSFAADHMISGDDAFLSAVTEAVEVARHDYLVTIGIAPSHPSTGFGYIQLGDKLGGNDTPNARLVRSFKEKPDARTAAAYIKTGTYRWNAGMFVTRAVFLMQLLKEYKPKLHDGLQKIAAVWDDESLREKVLTEVWDDLEKIPIDNAVAEPAAAEGRVAVVPATFGWDDVGDFASLADLLPAEANQPRILGENHLVLTDQVAGGIIVPGSGRLVACLGVDDLVIVDMPDTLLVTTRARSQEVKRLVKKAKDVGWKSLL